MKLSKVLLVAVIALFTGSSWAQDIHYSMYNMSPLTLNPANTGAFEGTFRIGGIFRDQWYSFLKNEFVTPSFYLDAPVLVGFGKLDWISVGVTVYQDQVGVGSLRTGSVLFSAAYHLALDKKGRSMFSVGLQGGMSQRRINGQSLDLMFEDELSLGGNLGTGNGVDRGGIAADNVSYFDLNAGLLFSQELNERSRFNIGVSGLHLITPNKYSLLGPGNNDSDLDMRFNAHATYRTDLGTKWMIQPTALYVNMRPASQLAVQGWGGRYLGEAKDMLLRFGLGYRWGDATEVLLGFDYKDLQVGLSYDINVSGFREATDFQGGFEIAASYIVKIYKEPTVPPVIFCPQL